MRIIQIGPFPLDKTLIRGGVESSVYGLAVEQANNHQVFVMDIPRKESIDTEEETDNLHVYRFSNKGNYQKDSIKRIADIVACISRLQPDICHIHGTGPFQLSIFNALKEKNIPTIVTVHGLIYIEKKKALKQHFSLKTLYQFCTQTWAERRLLNSVKEVIVDTEYVAETIKQYRLRHTPNMTIIPQGINDRYFSIKCSSISDRVLSVGAISKRKGHLLLVQAFEEVHKMNPNATLTICGSMADKEYYHEILSYIEHSDCRNCITIKTDLPQPNLMEEYRKAHVFALHSQEESQGIALVEAMATGLPVVSTRVGGIPFVVSNGDSGLLSDYGNTKEFGNALSYLLKDVELWEQTSNNAQKSSISYSWGSISGKVNELYLSTTISSSTLTK